MVGCLLELVRETEQPSLIKVIADELNAHRQAAARADGE